MKRDLGSFLHSELGPAQPIHQDFKGISATYPWLPDVSPIRAKMCEYNT